MTRARQALGEAGEALAADYLVEAGWRILARRWKAGRFEIDLVVERGGTVAFVEVKTRRPGGLAPPVTAVDGQKRRRIVAAAREGARRWRFARAFRFDVVGIEWGSDGPTVDHLEDAFRVQT